MTEGLMLFKIFGLLSVALLAKEFLFLQTALFNHLRDLAVT